MELGERSPDGRMKIPSGHRVLSAGRVIENLAMEETGFGVELRVA
jgi:hypothetical protein